MTTAFAAGTVWPACGTEGHDGDDDDLCGMHNDDLLCSRQATTAATATTMTSLGSQCYRRDRRQR